MKTPTQKMSFTLAALGALALGVSACDKPAENAAENTAEIMEDTADAVRADGENAADMIENKADMLEANIDNKADNAADAMENKADAARMKAEAVADKIENRADAVVDAAKGK